MKLGTIKELFALKEVLKDPEKSTLDPVYWVFYELTSDSWANSTIISPGKLGEEYPKTFGHYHPEDAPDEIYHVLSGKGILQLQKKHIENGALVPEIVDEVYLISAKEGEEIIIKKEFGHSWSNVGKLPLMQFDDWRLGHTPDDYEPIKKTHGMAYYLIEEDGKPKALKNPNYKSVPEPKWVSVEEFKSL